MADITFPNTNRAVPNPYPAHKRQSMTVTFRAVNHLKLTFTNGPFTDNSDLDLPANTEKSRTLANNSSGNYTCGIVVLGAYDEVSEEEEELEEEELEEDELEEDELEEGELEEGDEEIPADDDF